PWLFSEKPTPDIKERLTVMLEHAKLYDKLFHNIKHFDAMKRHFKAYVAGYEHAAELRAKLYETKSYIEVETVVQKFLASHK
nr:tRNA-dihydrouridine synthase [bacterium]